MIYEAYKKNEETGEFEFFINANSLGSLEYLLNSLGETGEFEIKTFFRK